MRLNFGPFHPIGWAREILDSFLDRRIPPDFRHNCELRGESLELNFGNYKSFRSVRLDIGLSHNAPYSAAWSKDHPETFVIGIEPNRFNAYRVKTFGVWSKGGRIRVRKSKPHNFHLIVCAIDNVGAPALGRFYMVSGDPGTSSLLEPTEKLLERFGYKIHEATFVIVLPLSLILEPLLRHFRQIDVIKIDTQGKDLAVLQSAGPLLRHVKKLLVEVDTHGQYKNAPESGEIDKYLRSFGFSREDGQSMDQSEDVAYVNLNFQPTATHS